MKTVIDPFNRMILFPPELPVEGDSVQTPLASNSHIPLVLETPSCMIDMSGERVFYIKSIAWNYTLLVEVVMQGGDWVAIRSQRNPSPATLDPLLQEGMLIPGRSIDQGL